MRQLKQDHEKPDKAFLRQRIHEIIFEADTPEGKFFDIALLVFIVISVIAVFLESVEELDKRFHTLFTVVEWVITIFFTIEYVLRIYSIRKPLGYVTSFYGIVDLLAILPTYLSIIFVGSHYLATIRALRLLRIFRIFKLGRYIAEARELVVALRASRVKITVFMGAVLTIVMIIGSMMYLIEGQQDSGFTSIPKSMYWAVVTMTTVGYGDITPVTSLGQLLSAALMLVGYAIIAVPTGIVGAEFASTRKRNLQTTNTSCPTCSREGHDSDAKHCKWCGEEL